jgi:hypothetical protein
MTHVPPSLADVVQRLLVHDARGGQGTQDLADAMERACQALHNRLVPLVGAAGFDALIGRAVKLAAREFPFLAAIVAMTAPTSSLDGLQPAVEGREPAEVRDALVAILTNLISLLVIFIGENLALRKMREVWPDMPLHSPESSSEKAPQ